ncbi:Uroporphyrinogen-III decarboxylase [Lachnospiraceae bacterium TWA4]|nr:Uroporphyrinogen-III decarboxylase [Lachnospiraceae bacterium TWA4]
MSEITTTTTNELPPIAIRGMRMQKAISLTGPDRVPFIPSMSNFYALSYNVSIYDAMKDLRFIKPVMQDYLSRFSPDLVYLPCFFPIDPMKFAGYDNVKWPGPDFNLPVNTPYQYVDSTFLEEDEYDSYLKDPSAFLMKKVLAKRYHAFAGLEYLNIQSLCGQSIFSLAALAAPPIKSAIENLLKTADMVQENLNDMIDITKMIVEKGFIPYGGSTASAPFDEFADNIRGLVNTCCDLISDPESVDEAINRWADISIPAIINQAKLSHDQYVFMPLHCGTDTFMSADTYREHYWPTLKRMLEEVVAADLTPLVFCEGKYDSKLDIIKDVPKGKIVYFFEDVDLENACRTLEGVANVAGGMRTQTLMRGNIDEVVAETKKSLEIGKKYGNFIMSNTLALDKIDLDVMQAWQDTTFEYGRY